MRPKGSQKTPGSGRTKGVPNKDTLPLKDKAAQLGIDPFEVLLYYASGDWKALGYPNSTKTMYTQSGDPYEVDIITPDHRITAAGKACEYLYPKRKSIEIQEHNVKAKVIHYDFRHDDEENPTSEENPPTEEN